MIFKKTLLKLKNKKKKLKPNKYHKKVKLYVVTLKEHDRPRLSVYRSNENIYAQIIDDTNSKLYLLAQL
jgi:ribosomal protein L18